MSGANHSDTTSTIASNKGEGAAPAIFPVVAVGIVAAWLVVVLVYVSHFNGGFSLKQDEWGQFGDYIGGLLNPLLGTLTLFGVLYTVHLQREVLAVARRQLDEASSYERNRSLLNERDSFESGFFQLLDMIRTTSERTSITLPADDAAQAKAHTGPAAFTAYLKAFEASAVVPVDRGDFPGQNRTRFLIDRAIELFTTHENELGPHLRSMGDLLQYVKDYGERVAASYRAVNRLPRSDTLMALTPTLRQPMFYALVMANSRTRDEIKVFAMYVACSMYLADRRAPPLDGIAREYAVFQRTIDSNWWGWRVFVEPQ